MATLDYNFRIVGLGAVKRALLSVEKSFIQHNSRMAKAAGVSPRGKPRGKPRSPERASTQASQKAFNQQRRLDQKLIQKKLRDIQKISVKELIAKNRVHQQNMRQIAKERAAEERPRKRFARATGGVIGRSIGGTTRAIGGTAAGLLGIGGGIAVASSVRRQVGIESASTTLANKAFREGKGPSREVLRESITRQAKTEGVRTGLGTENVIESLRQVVGISGNLDIAQQLQPFLSDISLATGADTGDVGRTAGQIVQAFSARGLQTPEILQKTQDVMMAMAGQAKVGSIEFEALAQQMGKLVSSTANFEGEADVLVSTMGAIAQLAIAGAASSPEEAMTAILKFSDDLITNAARAKNLGEKTDIEKGGVDVFVKGSNRTKLRAPEQIIGDMLRVTGGDLVKIQKVFKVRSKKAFLPFQKRFVDAGGGKSGQREIEKLLESVRGAKITRKELGGSAEAKTRTLGNQLTIASEELSESLGKEFTPVVKELVPVMKEMIPHVAGMAKAAAGFVSFLIANPLSGVGAIIAAKVAADLASAGISSLAAAGVERALSSPMVQKAAASALSGLKSRAGITIGVATVTATVLKLAIDSIFASAQEAQKSFVTSTVAGENIAGRATSELAREGQLRDKTFDAVVEETTRLAGELQGLAETPSSGLEALKGDLTGGPGIASFLRGREAFREAPTVGRLDKEGKLIEGKAKNRVDVILEQLTVLNKILELSGAKFKKDAEAAGEILKKKVEEAKAPTKLNATDEPQKGPVGG